MAPHEVGTLRNLPEGFHYRPGLFSRAVEAESIFRVRVLPFRDFEFHGYTGRRRVISFGWHYYLSRHCLAKDDDVPDYLLTLGM